jgi:hypothetical protein
MLRPAIEGARSELAALQAALDDHRAAAAAAAGEAADAKARAAALEGEVAALRRDHRAEANRLLTVQVGRWGSPGGSSRVIYSEFSVLAGFGAPCNGSTSLAGGAGGLQGGAARGGHERAFLLPQAHVSSTAGCNCVIWCTPLAGRAAAQLLQLVVLKSCHKAAATAVAAAASNRFAPSPSCRRCLKRLAARPTWRPRTW